MDNPTRPASIESARAALTSGRHAEAEAACLGILRRDEANPEALHVLALVRYQTGRAADAAKLLQKAVLASPGFAAAHNELGLVLVALNRPEEAVAPLRTALELEPDSVEALTNLGNALHAGGELQGAETQYRAAVERDPGHVRARLSLGNLLVQLRRPQEAVEHLAAAAVLAPRTAAAHQFLGNALRDLGRVEEAIASYNRALALEPGNPDANENLGFFFKSQDRLEEALARFRACGTDHARAQALECLLRLARHAEFFQEIERHSEKEATNLHSASLSAYAASQLGQRDPHPFCPDPLEHVWIVDRYTSPGPDADFMRDLIREASELNAVWEPRGVTTRRGFQTGGNLFAHGFRAMERLKGDILAELERYRAGLRPASMAIVTRWPRAVRLRGWYVRLLTGGHQNFHNHPFGWVSGCVYLQMPASMASTEGAIEFGLAGGDYPRLSDRPAPALLHNPKPGQIAFFPSSLYHRTIPFSSAEERLCIAFDVVPA